MIDRRDDEAALREAARGKVVAGSGTAIEPRKLDQMVSLRLDPEILAGLRHLAQQAGCTVSELLRTAAAELVAATDRRSVVWSITEYRGASVPTEAIQGVTTFANIEETGEAVWRDPSTTVVSL